MELTFSHFTKIHINGLVEEFANSSLRLPCITTHAVGQTYYLVACQAQRTAVPYQNRTDISSLSLYWVEIQVHDWSIITSSSIPHQPPFLARAHRIKASAVLNTLVTAEDSHDTIYIFTDFQSDNALGRAVCEEYRVAACMRGCAFIPVILTCSEEENMRRVMMSERSAHGRTKLMDAGLVAAMRGRSNICSFDDVQEQLVIDTTSHTVEAAAGQIARHLRQLRLL
ncbi:hypothetical protein EW146_g3817 [Bondarzewia mesenterica]|uniref:Uncharacterized protein n=1 Tax=Bondarzewia mesenterica TaxID=1095465 RepID=A0A4S4LY82_9AGAM|nr:hypothetical protein EW146_g3817 [Bondarzewia mesenterica]